MRAKDSFLRMMLVRVRYASVSECRNVSPVL